MTQTEETTTARVGERPPVSSFLIVACLFMGTVNAPGQTLVDLRSQTRNVDFSNALSTKPFQAGVSLPLMCSVGQAFLNLNGTPGQNLYICTVTNTWTVQAAAVPNCTGSTGKVLSTDGVSLQWRGLGGDLTGSPDAAVVGRMQGRPINPSAPSAGQLLRWDGVANQWSPSTETIGSVFGRTGTVVAATGDYNTSQVTEGTNLYFTNARAVSALAGLYQTPITRAPGTWPAFAAVATSGSYTDLSNKPTIPTTTTQISEGSNLYFTNARAVSAMAGLYQTPITGVPSTWPAFSAVATSGNYNDLSNKPFAYNAYTGTSAVSFATYTDVSVTASGGNVTVTVSANPATSGTAVNIALCNDSSVRVWTLPSSFMRIGIPAVANNCVYTPATWDGTAYQGSGSDEAPSILRFTTMKSDPGAGGCALNGDGSASGGCFFPTSTGPMYRSPSDVVYRLMTTAQTYRVCDLAFGDASGSAIANAQLGPQVAGCFVPAASTVVEIDVRSDAGTPNIIIGGEFGGTVSNLVSAALATGSSGARACSKTTAVAGIDGTTCSGTLQNTALAAGTYIQAVSGTAGGTAKWLTAHVVYTVN